MQFERLRGFGVSCMLASMAASCHDGSAGVLNELPRITSRPPPSAMLGSEFTYQVSALDADRGALTFALKLGPQAALIDSSSGFLSWTPGQEGTFDFEVAVQDSSGGRSVQTFSVEVTSAPTQLVVTSPIQGEQAVALTRETILEFDRPIQVPKSLGAAIRVQSGGHDLPARIEPSPDGRGLTLFYAEPLPAASLVQVLISGDDLLDAGQVPIDADGDGAPGGLAVVGFSTITVTPIEGTAVCGRVFASEFAGEDPPVDDPLVGVEIRVEGTDLITTTNEMGNFRLEPAPAGRVFVVIDGKTASNPRPAEGYYPTVGKAFETSAGHEKNVGDIYLPLIPPETLNDISESEVTIAEFPDAVKAANPALVGTQLLVSPGSLFADDGTRGGKVGISPVPSDRIPGKLPEFLKFQIVFTIQTDGPTNFAVPAPVRFPNLPDPETSKRLRPGEKSALWSFNHDVGAWEMVGSMTVTNDGGFIESDPGVGIRAPGWHGTFPGSTTTTGPTGPPCPSQPPPIKAKRTACIADLDPCIKGLYATLNRCYEASKGMACISAGNDSCHESGSQHYCNKAIDLSARNTGRCGDDCGEDGRYTMPGLLRIAQCIAGPDATAFTFDAARKVHAARFPIVNDGGPCPEGVIQVEDDIFDANGKQRRWRHIHIELSGTCTTPKPAECKDYECSCGELPGSGLSLEKDVPVPPFFGYVQADEAPPLRFVTSGTGFSSSMVRSSRLGVAALFDSETRRVWVADFFTAAEGSSTAATKQSNHEWLRTADINDDLQSWGPDIDWLEDNTGDEDKDGLGEISEGIIGTDTLLSDTDGDGLGDGIEVELGSDPLDGLQVRTGVVGSAPTQDYAADVFALNDLVLVADSTAGLAVFNVFSGMEPELVAQVDTQGSAKDVALIGSLAVVADGTGGLVAIDLAAVPTAAIVWTAPLGDVSCVASIADLVVAGLSNGRLATLDGTSGVVLDELVPRLAGPVQDIEVFGETLFVLTQSQLHVIPWEAGSFVVAKTLGVTGLATSGRRRRLFAEDSVLYVVHANGYDTYDISIPLDPVPIAQGNSSARGWRHIVTNGDGIGVAAVGLNVDGSGSSTVDLYDTSNPALTDLLLGRFSPPVGAEAIALYNGLAYVADGDAGLQVINYLAYDSDGLPPTVVVSTVPDGPTIDEDSILLVKVSVEDDVQVRNVELLIDDEVVATDGNHPYQFFFRVPSRSLQTALKVAVRASDTGGNRSALDERGFDIVPDSTYPRLLSTTPRTGDSVYVGFGGFRLLFSEAMDTPSVEASARVVHAGADDTFGTSDDLDIPVATSFSVQDKQALVGLQSALPLGRAMFTLDGAIARDLAKNLLDANGDGIPGDLVQIVVNASNTEFFLSEGGDPAGDILWEQASVGFVEESFAAFSNGSLVDAFAVGATAVDVDLDGPGGFSEIAHVVAGDFRTNPNDQTTTGIAVVGQACSGCSPRGRITLNFTPPVRGAGAWLFDDYGPDLQFQLEIVDGAGFRSLSEVLSSDELTGRGVEGFLGVMSADRIARFTIISLANGVESNSDFVWLDSLHVAE
ncbi:MAG: putative Ig domain-containing protein [Planctomycetota bacterium]